VDVVLRDLAIDRRPAHPELLGGVSTEINIIGNLVGSYNDLCDLMALAARGAVKLHTVKYALDDFQSAIDDLDAGKVRGRAILTP
jgi:NAD+-dependent secondary alcohol dehydrogenase Adh1